MSDVTKSVAVVGGTIATDYATFRADLLLRNGRIAAICEDARTCRLPTSESTPAASSCFPVG